VQAQEVAGTLEELVADGLIRAYGWSTGDPQRAAAFAGGAHCAAIQHPLNVLADAPDMLAVCDAHGLASVNNGPLAMGRSPASTAPRRSCRPMTCALPSRGWATSPAAARPRCGWPGWMLSARCSPAAGGPWRRGR
jgi:aryl-alcohol dehydrogenase-like predicted oxidoreductase